MCPGFTSKGGIVPKVKAGMVVVKIKNLYLGNCSRGQRKCYGSGSNFDE